MAQAAMRKPTAPPQGGAPPASRSASAPAASAAKPAARQGSKAPASVVFDKGRHEWRSTYRGLPASTVVRIFFDLPDRPSSCSGAVMNAPNRSVVWTAAHCIQKAGAGSESFQNFIVVPAYNRRSGSITPNCRPTVCPYGQWPARVRGLWTMTKWAQNASHRHDLAAIIVERLNGRTLFDAVGGGHGIDFDQPARQRYVVLGYPYDAPFPKGRALFYCNVPFWKRGSPEASVPGPQTIGVLCDLTGGSSGGPWLTKVDPKSGLGIVTTVMSYGDTPKDSFGSYQSGDAAALWNYVKNLE